MLFRDRKKKKYVVRGGDKSRLIRTENGTRIPASFKSSRYSDWATKHKMDKCVFAYMRSCCSVY